MITETLAFAALFVNGTPPQRGGPMKRYGQQARVAGGAIAGGAKGAVKGAKRGAKVGGAAGKATGAGIGAAAGSVLPGAGTAAGARIGGAIGQVAGKGIGAGIGAGIGGAKGAHDGAAKARARQLQRQQQQNAMRQVSSAVHTLNTLRNFAANPALFAVGVVKKHIWKIAVIIIVAFFVGFFLFDDSGMNQQQTNLIADQGQTQTNPLQITKTGPTTGAAGQPLQYSITVFYPGTADNIVITDPLPEGTSYVSSCAGATPCKSGGTFTANTVTWDAKKLKLSLTNPISITVGLTVKSKQNNVYVINYATASVSGGLLSNNAGGNVAANQNTCGGKYTLNTPYGNFGDPQCNFTPQALGTLLKQLDPANYYTWDCIAQNESTKNPNAYNPNSKSGNGAYGLFQMNPTGKGNDQYDDGTANWPVQTSNAINYRNKELKGSWAYWTGDGCV